MNGVYEEKEGESIKLWSIISLLPFLISCLNFNYGYVNEKSLDTGSMIQKEILKESGRDNCLSINNVEIDFNQEKPELFFANVEWEKDWWGELKVGRILDDQIKWLEIKDSPSEQSILTAKSIKLSGFKSPMLEVYGQTHAGHGAYYLYEVGDKDLKLLLNTPAVDINSDFRWAPDNREKYGYEECGEVFSGGKLTASYKDVNDDGISDVILSGKQRVVCEKDPESMLYEKDNEVEVADMPVAKTFLWNSSKKVFMEE